MEYSDALKEVQEILNKNTDVNLNKRILEIMNMYKDELEDFEYIINTNDLLYIKNKFIRYVEYNNKLNYGGILIKSEKIGNRIYIYLINKHKQMWTVNADKNFIFCNNILTQNEKIRKSFEKFLLLKSELN
jgi:hypothetical protein